MNEQTYEQQQQQQAITAYLLGSLSDDEAERFDELSFTDDDFAARLQAAEKDLVDAYVHGELSGSTLEQFKSYYLASPLRREKVEFAQAFQIFAEKSAAAQNIKTLKDAEPVAVGEEEPRRTRGGFFSNLFSVPRLSMQWGFALATLFFVFFAGWLLLENSRLRNQTDEAQAQRLELQRRENELENEITNQRSADADKEAELTRVRDEIARLEQKEQEQKSQRIAEIERERRRRLAEQQQQSQTANTVKLSPAPMQQPSQINIASFILTPQLRGGSQIQTLSIPEKTGSVDLRLELEPNDYETFRVTLANQSGGRVLWRSGAVKAKGDGEDKSLNIRFPAKLLKSEQIYTLEVSGNKDGAGEIVSNYSFRTAQK